MVVDGGKHGAALIVEFVPMSNGLGQLGAHLGKKLAKMHQHESKKGFGFHVKTAAGRITLNNDWHHDWVEFFARNRMDYIMREIEKVHGDREVAQEWSKLQPILPKFFKHLQGGKSIRPVLIHGDLWAGNAAETLTKPQEPIIFDPGSFYAHNEFELSISHLFGGFPSTFYDAYHAIHPRAKQYRQRLTLYKLFHNLNHYAHFGGHYRYSALSQFGELIKHGSISKL